MTETTPTHCQGCTCIEDDPWDSDYERRRESVPDPDYWVTTEQVSEMISTNLVTPDTEDDVEAYIEVDSFEEATPDSTDVVEVFTGLLKVRPESQPGDSGSPGDYLSYGDDGFIERNDQYFRITVERLDGPPREITPS